MGQTELVRVCALVSILVDGYNLLHASGILGRGRGAGSLERSRTALLDFLADSLDGRQLAGTTVVFDARMAPPGLPRTLEHRGLKVRFAARGSEADELIEQLIVENTAPRRLTVVSSDHRLHRAARRRRAKAIDSDKWYAEVLRQRIERARKRGPRDKRTAALSEREVRYWLRQFGIDETADGDTTIPGSPFPPGYGEDVE